MFFPSSQLLTKLTTYIPFLLSDPSLQCFFLRNLLSLYVDAYVEHMKEELVAVEAESSKISNEIEVLKRTNIEGSLSVYVLIYTFQPPICVDVLLWLSFTDSNKLKMDLEVLKLSLDRFPSQVGFYCKQIFTIPTVT